MSLKNTLQFYLERKPVWVNGGELERYSLELGFKASNGSRRLRDLVKEGKILRKIEKGSVWYRSKSIVAQINSMQARIEPKQTPML